MEISRIAELLAPYAEIAPDQLATISTYVDILLRWNARTNLTAVRDPEQIIERHFGESLFAARYLLTPESKISVIDVGSGAGFPGLILKIFAPQISLTLIESQNKKATFLKEVCRQLKLSGVEVLNVRAEHAGRKAELVTLRAVESFEQIVPIAASLVSRGGRLALLIGSSQVGAAQELSLGHWDTPLLIPGSASRVLAVCHPDAAQ